MQTIRSVQSNRRKSDFCKRGNVKERLIFDFHNPVPHRGGAVAEIYFCKARTHETTGSDRLEAYRVREVEHFKPRILESIFPDPNHVGSDVCFLNRNTVKGIGLDHHHAVAGMHFGYALAVGRDGSSVADAPDAVDFAVDDDAARNVQLAAGEGFSHAGNVYFIL